VFGGARRDNDIDITGGNLSALYRLKDERRREKRRKENVEVRRGRDSFEF
jgi:hypothetical protein